MQSAGAAAASAKPAFTGPDFSGVYECAGNDDHEGKYTGTVTFELVPAQSVGQYGAYRFKLEVPGYGAYPGQAAANGTRSTGTRRSARSQSTSGRASSA